MCSTCGCGAESHITIQKPGEGTHHHSHAGHHHEHNHSHNHEHEHAHDHIHKNEIEIQLEKDILNKNNLLAERNRGYFDAKNIFAINLLSSPGSGKTSLLERTIKELNKELFISVIEGDQQTTNDAKRIEDAGASAIQINTGNGCHLDSEMVNTAVKKLDPANSSVLFIENVGNLVCPSLFDLGETKRVVVMSITEGEDKPIKYPNMFQTADICIINKMDLLPHLDYDLKKAKDYALQVNHHLKFFEVSVKSGEGMANWYKWLKDQI